MQHLVKQNVFDRITRHAGMVEDAADYDGIVRGIVVSETAAGVVLAPGKLRTTHEPVEKAAIEVVEDFFQMIVVSARGNDVLTPAHLADEARFRGDIMRADIAAITTAVDAVDRLAIKLGEQNVGDRMQHIVGSAFQEIGDADKYLSFAQADGVVDGNKRIETHMHERSRCARTKFAVGLVQNFGELWGHVEARLAEAVGSRQPSAVSRQHSVLKRSMLNLVPPRYGSTHCSVTRSRRHATLPLAGGPLRPLVDTGLAAVFPKPG